MQAIRGRQPLIPSLWSLELEGSGGAAVRDPLFIQQRPASMDAQSDARGEPQPTGGGVGASHHPCSEQLQQSTHLGHESTSGALNQFSGEQVKTATADQTQRQIQPVITVPNVRATQDDQSEKAIIQRVTDADPQGAQLSGTSQKQWVVCEGLLKEEAAGIDAASTTWSTTPLLDLSLTFRLHSNPTAAQIIYLDFDGHTTTGTAWNSGSIGSSFYSPAYDLDGNPAAFSTTELTRIQQIWQRVVSDFAPFDVDVTTQAPPNDWLMRSSSTDANYGIRVVITNYGPSAGSAGGIAIVDSFTAATDTPAFVYNLSVVGVSEAISHEVGHTLGLSHDGTATSSYYTGHGVGETAWGPIMGASYNSSVTTWDNGVYYGSNNSTSTANYGKGADDIAIISTRNGFGVNADVIGSDFVSSSPLTVLAGGVNQFGIIETASDRDVYSFQLLDVGSISLSFNPYAYRAYVDSDGVWGGVSEALIAPVSDFYAYTSWPENGASLDLSVSLFNAAGELLAESNSAGLAAALNASGLAAGSYFLALDGVGYGDPASSSPTGYTDYCSIGSYCITGSIVNAADNAGPGSSGSSGSGNVNLKPSLSISDLSRREGTGTTATVFQVSVSLSAPSTADIFVNYSSADGTAISSGSNPDYMPVSGTLRIAAGLTTGLINLNVQADSLLEADEQLLINLSSPVGADLVDSQAIVTILNDDSLTKRKGPAKGLVGTSIEMGDLALFPVCDPITGEILDEEFQLPAVADSPSSPPPSSDPLVAGWDSLWTGSPLGLNTLPAADLSPLESVMPAALPLPGSDLLGGWDSSPLVPQLLI